MCTTSDCTENNVCYKRLYRDKRVLKATVRTQKCVHYKGIERKRERERERTIKRVLQARLYGEREKKVYCKRLYEDKCVLKATVWTKNVCTTSGCGVIASWSIGREANTASLPAEEAGEFLANCSNCYRRQYSVRWNQ